MELGMKALIALPFEETKQAAITALKEEGFGILTEIDVQATLAEKIGAGFRPYTILGACNPTLAYRGLQAELDLGLMLPCNVVLYQDGDDEGSTVVSIFDPEAGLSLIENEELAVVAVEAKTRLLGALASLAGGSPLKGEES